MDIFKVREEMRYRSIRDIPLRVTYYARVSSERDEQLNSLNNQQLYYEEYIKSNPRWEFVAGYVDEGITGITTKKRENFHRMIEDAVAGKFDYIVTKEISRFARNTLDSIGYTRKLLANGVAVFFQNDNINTLDEDSEFRLTIMAGVAQDEVRKLSSRVKFGHKQAIKNGVVLGNSHFYGYDKEKGKLVINENEAEMIRYIFETYATGDSSTNRIEDDLYRMGYRSYKGGKINSNVIKNIIRNPKYKGYYCGNKVKIIDMFTKKQHFLPEDEWVMYKDEEGEVVPAIVSEELWEAANRVYRVRSDMVKGRKSSCKKEKLFTGKIICAEHGVPYWLKAKTDRSGNANGTWLCSHRIKNGMTSCDSIPLKDNELSEILSDVLKEITDDFDIVAERYIQLYEDAAEAADHSEEIEKLEQELEQINRKKDKLLEYSLAGQIKDREYLRRNALLNEDADKIEDRIAELKSQQTNTGLQLEEVYRLKKELKNYDCIAPEDFTQGIINLLIDKIYVEPIGSSEDCRMRLKIVLNTGELRRKVYEREKMAENQGLRSGQLFLNKYGERITTRGISGQLKKLAVKYGINPAVVYPHSFRHRFAKSFLDRCNDIAFLADLMGHESIETTRIYLRKSATEQQEIVDTIVDW